MSARIEAAARAIGAMGDNGYGEVKHYNRWRIAEVALAAADAVEASELEATREMLRELIGKFEDALADRDDGYRKKWGYDAALDAARAAVASHPPSEPAACEQRRSGFCIQEGCFWPSSGCYLEWYPEASENEATK